MKTETQRLETVEREALKKFLKGRVARRMPAVFVAKRFNISANIVRWYRKRLGRQISFRDACKTNKHRLAFAKCQESGRKYFRNFWSKRQRELEGKLRRIRTRSSSLSKARKCKRCRKVWPATEEFFYPKRRLKNGRVLLKSFCRACGGRRGKERVSNQ